MFPIEKRQEHIFIGFLLAKAQLSPDDYGNAHDDHDHEDIIDNRGASLYQYCCFYRTQVRS